uniref:Uncharacterized protein n=1 Tax=Acrobeloides nanus TaxID=290746 RepID=A0A914EMF8_9BILA
MTIVLVINHACHFLAYPQLAETTCWSPGCIFSYRAKVVYPIVKFGTAFLIIVASSYFFYLLRNFNRSEILLHPDVHKRKIGNFLVKYIIFIEFSFNFVPFLLWSMISNIFVFPLATYLGPLLICLNSIDGCCCAFMFSAKLTKVKTNTISVN